MTGIQVTSPDDRPSREEQIAQLCGQVEYSSNVKLRVLPQLYDEDKQQYAGLRDAQWTLSIPKATLRPDSVENILRALGAALKAIGELGSEDVIARLRDDQ